MITDGEEQHYLAKRKLAALLQGITAKHDGDYYLQMVSIQSEENKSKQYKNMCKHMIIAM